MDVYENVDSVNDELYSLEVPNEPIKKLMFYLTVLHNVIRFSFPENYLNFQNPYFQNNDDLEAFFSLCIELNPDYLHQNNIIKYNNQKKYYKYYQIFSDPNGLSYEFKIIDYSRSLNEFHIDIQKKIIFSNSDDSLEELYLSDENSENCIPNSVIREVNQDNQISKNIIYQNDEASTDEIQSSEDFSSKGFFNGKVEIMHQLVVTNDWVDYIYDEPMKEIIVNIKKVLKEKDIIREKSISLHKNIFFYLDVNVLIILGCLSACLINWAVALQKDSRFIEYQGNITNNNTNDDFIFFNDEIDYLNDSIIVPDPRKYKIMYDGCLWSESSGVLGFVFILFIVYMYVRVAREKKKKYEKEKHKHEAGLNMCLIIFFILFTFCAFLISILAEIFIGIPVFETTYYFIHEVMLALMMFNTFLFVSYILIVAFFIKI